MPVDDEINLNDPEGLTQDDLDIMNRDADELAKLAEGAERNAEKIKKATDSLKKMDFATKNIIQSEVQGTPNDMSSVDISTRLALVEQQLLEMGTHVKVNKESHKEAETHRHAIEKKMVKGFSKFESKFNEADQATSNPIGFGKNKIIGFIGKAGPYGAIAIMMYEMVVKLWENWKDTFKAGGINDIRKLMEDRDREMMEMQDLKNRRSGQVFFSSTSSLSQGSVDISSTESLRDQAVRYQALHLGE